MKASIIFFLLAISASAVVSNPKNDVECILTKIDAIAISTIDDIMKPLGIEYEDIKELGSKTLTAFNTMIKAASDGEFDEEAFDDDIKYFKEIVLAMNSHIGYDVDDLLAAMNTKIEKSRKAMSAVFNGTMADVYEGVYEEMSAYSNIFAILSAVVDVDVSVQVSDTEEYLYRLFISIHKPNSNDFSDAESGAKAFNDLFTKIMAKFLKALDIEDDQDFNELVNEVTTGIQGTVAAAANGKFDDESIKQTIGAWGKILTTINKYAQINEEELSTPKNDAVAGFLEAVEGAVSSSLSRAVKGVHKSLSGYTNGLQLFAKKLRIDISDELYKSRNAYYACFSNFNWDAPSDDNKSNKAS